MSSEATGGGFAPVNEAENPSQPPSSKHGGGGGGGDVEKEQGKGGGGRGRKRLGLDVDVGMSTCSCHASLLDHLVRVVRKEEVEL